jgi:LAO/AO transport system kinase
MTPSDPAAGDNAWRSHLELGRLLTRVERDPAFARQALAGLPPRPATAHRIGVTGSPGVGKSTLLGWLIRLLRERGERVGVVAVDPTSPLSGGALLGDRLRLAPAHDDPGLFIRSLASRGSLGGVTPAASGVAAVLEAAGYERILIETVGVGQTGYDVVSLADTVLALFSPESGDALQFMKAGILEIGDIFAVNKADRPGAEVLLKEITYSLSLERAAGAPGGPAAAEWTPPVLAVTASTGEGMPALLAQLDAHRAWLAGLPPEHPRRLQRIARELAFVVRSAVDGLIDGALAEAGRRLAGQVLRGEVEFWTAAAGLQGLVRDNL